MEFLKKNRIYVFITLFTAVSFFIYLIKANWRSNVIKMLLPPPSSREAMYPHAPSMPPVVAATADELLSKYHNLLSEQAPSLLNIFQPGLTDEAIDKLEAQYHFKLTQDLRALYRWQNGTRRAPYTETFPNHEFVPLERALALRDRLLNQVAESPTEQKEIHEMYVSHRDAWIGIMVDLAGDGYYYDPNRLESEGSFFFCFAEDGSYVFFPSFRNYLAAVIEGIESGIFKFDAKGVAVSDYEQARTLWRKYGAENVR